MRTALFTVLVATGLGAAFSAHGQSTLVLAPIVVTATPLGAATLDRAKISVAVQTITAEQFATAGSASVTDALARFGASVNLSDVQGSGFTEDLRYRGFAASPLQGTPQGLAVYMNGIRLNEAFGDTVNWDLLPPAAIARADIWSSNPVFGLNALGGAVNLGMKDGFSYQGASVDLAVNTLRGVTTSVQYGKTEGHSALYVALDGVKNGGWRLHSPSSIARMFVDLGWKNAGAEFHLAFLGGNNSFGVVGPTPVEMLANDRSSVFTWPQSTSNTNGLLLLTGSYELTSSWSAQGNLHVRNFRQHHIDGNDGDFERCSNASSYPGKLCMENDGFPQPTPVTTAFYNQFAVLDANGNPIAFAGAGVPYGTVDRTRNSTMSYGGALQITNGAPLWDHENRFAAGASIDRSRIGFSANSELGYIYPDLSVGPNASIPGTGQLIHTLANIGYAPVDLDARNTYYGLYATDTFDITPTLSATLGARLNIAEVTMADMLGTSPGLNGSYSFTRLNPTFGLTYRVSEALGFYANYSQSNRVPTPLELGCADPLRPCILEGFLVSDPPLKQVVAKSVEGGARGDVAVLQGALHWNIGVYRTDSDNDIVTLASVIQGRGYYQNIGATRRQGFEAGLAYRADTWTAYANYAFTDATYRFAGDVPSPNNPAADADGNVQVTPGKQIPGISRHQLSAGADYRITPSWSVGADVLYASGQYYIGDDANQDAKLPSYWTLNAQTSFDIGERMRLFGRIENLLNRKYATYGTYFDPDGVANAMATPPTDTHMQTPAAPFSLTLGIRIEL